MMVKRIALSGADSLLQAIFLTEYLELFTSRYYTGEPVLFYAVGAAAILLFSLLYHQITRRSVAGQIAVRYGVLKALCTIVLFTVLSLVRFLWLPRVFPVRELWNGDGIAILGVMLVYAAVTVSIRTVVRSGNAAQQTFGMENSTDNKINDEIPENKTIKMLIPLAIIGVVFMIAGFVHCISVYKEYQPYSETVVAKVVDLETDAAGSSENAASDTGCYLVLSYNVNGKRVEARDNTRYSYKKAEIGETVEIRYNPDQPESFVWADTYRDYRIAIWPVSIGIMLVMFSVIKIAGIQRKQRKKNLFTNLSMESHA